MRDCSWPRALTALPVAISMETRAVVAFESIVLEDQRIRGAADDHLLSVVHLEVRHPDGHWCPGCLASVRHRFRGAGGGAVEIRIQAAEECASYAHALESAAEAYYRERVGPDGSAIRVGPRGASPWLIGMQRLAPVTVSLPIGDPQ